MCDKLSKNLNDRVCGKICLNVPPFSGCHGESRLRVSLKWIETGHPMLAVRKHTVHHHPRNAIVSAVEQHRQPIGNPVRSGP
jgi:hypothetical protein